MLGHHISIGYNPCPRDTRENLEELLIATARQIADDHWQIIDEVLKFGCPVQHEGHTLRELCEWYKGGFGSDGHPISIVEGEHGKQVMQLASTDSADGIKYHVRRAFVRLLIAAMHKQGVEVNLHSV